MIKRVFETMFIIGLFGLVSNAISHYLSVPAGVFVYLLITIATMLVLGRFDKEQK